MKENVGQTDKIVRITAGLMALAAGIIFESWWGLIGIIPLATALVNRCPAYMPFGISTCSRKAKSES